MTAPDHPGAAGPRATSYWDYLRVDALLSLQGGVGGAPVSTHEELFIVVHQIYELWFKLAIRELRGIRDELLPEFVPDQRMSVAVHSLRRVGVIFEIAAQHWRVMETLSTRDFLDFREKLMRASGFQSGQFREVEAILGLDEAARIGYGGKGSQDRALMNADGSASGSKSRLDALRESGPPILVVLERWLHRTPILGSRPGDAGDAAVVAGFCADYVTAMERDIGDPDARAALQLEDPAARSALAARYRAEVARARDFLRAADLPEGTSDAERARRSRIRAAILFIESYRDLPLLAWPRELLDSLVALEQSMLIFRQRHARMVEREIGSRPGTGGSEGVAYLDSTALRYRVFKDLWAVRTILLRKGALPAPGDTSFYDYRFGG
ncbi:MAG: Tryptophan 2,3-dioxygenase [Planctomycetes bacterium]|nr:Tryptophan 2,3-dioxygenase [Planctomycetota bacterium]